MSAIDKTPDPNEHGKSLEHTVPQLSSPNILRDQPDSRHARGVSARTKIVTIRLTSDEDETAIMNVACAMGLAVTREPTGNGAGHIDWLVDSFIARCNMTKRESDIVKLIVIEGVLDHTDIGDRLSVCKATVKWHLHNVLTKSGARNQITLLRAVLGLPVAVGATNLGETE